MTAELVKFTRRLRLPWEASDNRTRAEHRGIGDGMWAKERHVNTGSPTRRGARPQPEPREGMTGLHGVAVEEEDGNGGKRRTTVAKDTARGTPQGAPISPLLANIYMRRFIVAWKMQGWERKLNARIVNYADDFVILCREKAAAARERMEVLLSRLKLKVNEKKTRICRVPDESFDFLGYTIGRCYSTKTGRAYIGTRPAKKRIQRICAEVSEMTRRGTTWREAGEVVGAINAKLRGWANYFSLGPVSPAYRAVDSHTRHRVRQWLCRKHKTPGQGRHCFPDEHLYETLGLVRLEKLTGNLPWAMAKS